MQTVDDFDPYDENYEPILRGIVRSMNSISFDEINLLYWPTHQETYTGFQKSVRDFDGYHLTEWEARILFNCNICIDNITYLKNRLLHSGIGADFPLPEFRKTYRT